MVHRPWLVPLLAGSLTALLAAGVAGVVTDAARHGDTRAEPPSTTTTAPPPTTAPHRPTTTAPPAGSVAAFIPVAERFVEQHRGHPFKQPPTVTFLGDAAFRQRLQTSENQDKADLDKTTKVLRALGLIPAGTDVAKAESSLLGDAVAGFYDTKTKSLVVRGVQATPYVRQVLVHELTHALQDQYFDIAHPELDNVDDERPDGLLGLVEGDATRIEDEYRSSLPASEQRQAAAEEDAQGGSIDPSVPPALLEILGFPYEAGPPFTEALVRAGGTARLDAAFAHPPSTTEQLLHPAKYLAGEGAKAVTAPTADGKVMDTGVLGELGVALILEPAERAGVLSNQDLVAARAGWGGDRYVAWNQGSRSCVRDRITMDSAGDMQQLLAALHKLAGTRSGISVSGTDPVTLTSCG